MDIKSEGKRAAVDAGLLFEFLLLNFAFMKMLALDVIKEHDPF